MLRMPSLGTRSGRRHHGIAGEVAPGAEQQSPAGLQYAESRAHSHHAVREEHGRKLARHRVKRLIQKLQCQRVRLLESHALDAWFRGGMVRIG
jgi:hypothetical protein